MRLSRLTDILDSLLLTLILLNDDRMVAMGSLNYWLINTKWYLIITTLSTEAFKAWYTWEGYISVYYEGKEIIFMNKFYYMLYF